MLVLAGTVIGGFVVLTLKAYAKNRTGPFATAARIVDALAIVAVTVVVVAALAASVAVLALIAAALFLMALLGMIGKLAAGW